MKERPILFKGEMVRAILEGRKTQTRRMLDLSPFGLGKTPTLWELGCQKLDNGKLGPYAAWFCCSPEMGITPKHLWHQEIKCPYGQPGDRLWVREKFVPRQIEHGEDDYTIEITYPADQEKKWWGIDEIPEEWGFNKTRNYPSIHMPRWASRILLEVVDVHVEHLNEITEAEAEMEGCPYIGGMGAKAHFMGLWEAINGKRASWGSNPWVWVVTFKRIKP